MKIKFMFFAFIFLSLRTFVSAQVEKSVRINFLPTFGQTTLRTGEYYKLRTGDSIRVDELKFYISSIELWKNDSLVLREDNSFHLCDIQEENTLHLSLNGTANLQFNKIKFNIGIDSLTNCAGVMGGDLDPTHGMYWTWQSGYINFKIEGVSNICHTRKNEFEFHIGGYKFPDNSLQKVVLFVNENNNIIMVDVEELFNNIDLSNQNHVMTPGSEAVIFSEKILKTFRAKTE